MDLKQINSACRVASQKPIRKLLDLPIDFPKEIVCAKRVSGKYGPQILLELEECVVFFPQRSTAVLAPHLESLKGYRIVFYGTKKINSHHEQADFQFLEAEGMNIDFVDIHEDIMFAVVDIQAVILNLYVTGK
ncbi:hypothetical protein ABEB36_015335 [Hypothenemus hampei]|uniref:Uncharacterized protein n=1 Tax=Hypothenemus hampei TaxID=57062 RepID=A0ABD1E1X2_HYPHA